MENTPHFIEKINPDVSGALEELADLIHVLGLKEDAKENMKTELGFLNKEIEILRSEKIPELLARYDLSEIKLKNGKKISITQKYFCSLPKNDLTKRDSSLAWVQKNNGSDIIKSTINISFSKEEFKAFKSTKDILFKNQIPFLEKEDIHPATLKAYLKESIEQGLEVPHNLFNLFIKNDTKIK